MRDVGQLPSCYSPPAIGPCRDWDRTVQQRRMRRVSRTYAASMTTFTADRRARRSRYCAASRAGRDDLRMALAAIWVGPDRLPVHAFSDQLQIATDLTTIAHESRLTESDNLRVASWGHSRASTSNNRYAAGWPGR